MAGLCCPHSNGSSKLRKSTLRGDSEDRGQNDVITSSTQTSQDTYTVLELTLMFPPPFYVSGLDTMFHVWEGFCATHV